MFHDIFSLSCDCTSVQLSCPLFILWIPHSFLCAGHHPCLELFMQYFLFQRTGNPTQEDQTVNHHPAPPQMIPARPSDTTLWQWMDMGCRSDTLELPFVLMCLWLYMHMREDTVYIIHKLQVSCTERDARGKMGWLSWGVLWAIVELCWIVHHKRLILAFPKFLLPFSLLF